MARTGKPEPVRACLDADVLIAGLLSRTGASHAILVLGEIGLLDMVLPEAAVEEVRRNLSTKLPEAAPLFEEFLRAVAVRVYRLTPRDRERARDSPTPRTSRFWGRRSGPGHGSWSRTTCGTSDRAKACAWFGRERSSRKPGPGWRHWAGRPRALGQDSWLGG